MVKLVNPDGYEEMPSHAAGLTSRIPSVADVRGSKKTSRWC